ncbi:hypothetical protein A2334_04670 [Candidatus Roizmanbacteria bacterium RIFOXYB2_FULL_38_10]|uniref:Uncharacterized protein n=1 Tax=Candidatus Roizmanbacteria bacterium RIFOXYD1_FULL_38_12 TaxID=1802093 RepID=A0A1F7KZU7_9BACT|nr:MAG: hypothetical protein A3K47_00770 [Candidatus Roizmanbacteria bacterium RIFOXYA2_FULL_38_14]OGK63321.1 MAG: hypothetical protein A3K27_00770 [Candidatus Roizmanbacteria bacterium RIFOXYA1_FULL_37_12]OGK65167.1 MAG: hypothetical protein A3K38_00770 [Candidatus Roizmanbacteria bacterium RIFOXYB1_FULL_40_23]OGK68723.1 MAG: hypothetical protein A2334_04670 [Candidatus Roizmanbacteria bacterium RIFOXYB2_FULL_38_10]OGK69572.1 MAG: hypothetical protein A3K21_00775 [Candidatus Roizmanbacteria ba
MDSQERKTPSSYDSASISGLDLTTKYPNAVTHFKGGEFRFAHGNPRAHFACMTIALGGTGEGYREWYDGQIRDFNALREELGLPRELSYYLSRLARPVFTEGGGFVRLNIFDMYKLLYHAPAEFKHEMEARLLDTARLSKALIGKGCELPPIGGISLSCETRYGFQEGTVDIIFSADTPPEVEAAADVEIKIKKPKKEHLSFIPERHKVRNLIPKRLPLWAVRLVPEEGGDGNVRIGIHASQRIVEETGTIPIRAAHILAAFPRDKDKDLVIPGDNTSMIENVRKLLLAFGSSKKGLDRAILSVANLDESIDPKVVPYLYILSGIPGTYIVKRIEQALNGFPFEEFTLILAIQMLQKMGYKNLYAIGKPNSVFSRYLDPIEAYPYSFGLFHAGTALGLSEQGRERLFQCGFAPVEILLESQKTPIKKVYR